jgi:hypothetical protein
MNIGEYNTIVLVQDNSKKKTTILLYFFIPSSLKCKRKAIMYYSSPGAI